MNNNVLKLRELEKLAARASHSYRYQIKKWGEIRLGVFAIKKSVKIRKQLQQQHPKPALSSRCIRSLCDKVCDHIRDDVVEVVACVRLLDLLGHDRDRRLDLPDRDQGRRHVHLLGLLDLA